MNANIITRFTNSLSTECVVNTAQEAEEALKTAERLNNLTSGFIVCILKQVHEKNLYKEYGVKSTSAFAEKVLNIARSTASEYVKVGKYFLSPNATVFANEEGDFSPSVLVECMRQKLTDEEIKALPRGITVKEVRKKKKTIEPDGSELEEDKSEISADEPKEEKTIAKEEDRFTLTRHAIDGIYQKFDKTIVTRAEIVAIKAEFEKNGYFAMAIYGDKIILMADRPENDKVTTIYTEYTKM